MTVPTTPGARTLASDGSPDAVLRAATVLAHHLADGVRLNAELLRGAMEGALAASDATGAWLWRDAYDAAEIAQLLVLRHFWPAIRATTPPARLAMLTRLAALAPTQTRRTEEAQAHQLFSTPLPFGAVAALAAGIRSDDLVLEPSAGNGLLAVHAELTGARLALNEITPDRARLLGALFPAAAVSAHDAEAIHDRLDPTVRPTVVLMNPPFSASPHVDDRRATVTWHHVASALARLRPGGRLVAVTADWFTPENPAWAAAFARLTARGGHLVLTVPIARGAFARQGTSVATRLSVFDKGPLQPDPIAAASLAPADTVAALYAAVEAALPPRLAVEPSPSVRPSSLRTVLAAREAPRRAARPLPLSDPHRDPRNDAIALTYETTPIEAAGPGHGSPDAGSSELYEPYAPQTIRIPGAQPHPTPLVESAAMASVTPPRPSYRPRLPQRLVAEGGLSDAQLAILVYAGEAHAGYLEGTFTVDETGDRVSAAPADANGAVRYRRGYFVGDGTGTGKGRQAAGVILDNWLQGRRRALWLSKSDALVEDATRDWTALGGARHQVVPLSRWKQGDPITLGEGTLFVTYATLRSEAREGKASRLRQTLDWCGPAFDGVVVLDEAHELGNAAGGTSERGDVAPSQQGRAGLRLQNLLPDARVLYVSATGASRVQGLAYAARLGLWGSPDLPFATRADFVAAMEVGGVAALEVLARDLKSLGLYGSRSLSFHGVEYELVEHALTPEQTRIYDLYAGAFQIIHANLQAALEAANITGVGGQALNSRAKAAAHAAFESNKQRFFGHLLTGMKGSTLIAAIGRDLEAGLAPVVQIVSTGEALLERRLAHVPAAEWSDVQVDVTPREYVLDYLLHSWPTQAFEVYTDAEGHLLSRPAADEHGRPLVSREAVERRDRMIERLAALPAVQSALDQLVQHFGTAVVAEVTGRSRRIVRRTGGDGRPVLAVERRAVSANITEAQAFMDGTKRVLVFSDAGGTGRSYHSDLGAKNQARRTHYLLEPGWRADSAVQGLGRTHRTNQASPPLFRPVTTNVRGEKRFTSTIARRLDALGAITRGQRQTGGQNLFRAEDNLESDYARTALRQFYAALHRGQVADCSLGAFEAATGLSLTDRDGSLREELPPIQRFLNRLLALPIALQNHLFAVFEAYLTALVEGARAGGAYDVGVETILADSLAVTDRRTVYVHPKTGAETRLLSVRRRERLRPMTLDEALQLARAEPGARLLVNARSGHAAVQVPAWSLTREDGSVDCQVRLVRPTGRDLVAADGLVRSHWHEVDRSLFAGAWEADVARAPEHRDSTLHVLCGLLLPIWTRLPAGAARVYRLTTDTGERIIGRVVPDDALTGVLDRLGVTGPPPTLTPADAFAAVLERGAVLTLDTDLQVRRSLVMGAPRVEVTGYGDGAVGGLKALGLFAEIIAWRLRLFVPTDARGPVILGSLLERHPVGAVSSSGVGAAAGRAVAA